MLIRMRRLVGGAVAVACLFTSFVTLGARARARAQKDLIESDPAVVRARAEVEAAQLAAHAAADDLEKATEQRDATQASIHEHVAHVAELDAQRADLGELHTGVFELARRAQGGAGGDVAELLAGGRPAPRCRPSGRRADWCRHRPGTGRPHARWRSALSTSRWAARSARCASSSATCATCSSIDACVASRCSVAFSSSIGGLVRGELRGLDLGARSDHGRIGLDQILLLRAQPVPRE